MSYDSDVATFSPTGKLNQITYAMEAPSFGSPSVGLASKDAVVLVAVRRQTTPLSSFQDKLFEVDKHIGICISGIYADAYKMLRLLRDECTEYTYVYDTPHPVGPWSLNLPRMHRRARSSGATGLTAHLSLLEESILATISKHLVSTCFLPMLYSRSIGQYHSEWAPRQSILI